MHVGTICKISFSRHPPHINQYSVAILRRNTKLTGLHKPTAKIYFYERQSYRLSSAGFDSPALNTDTDTHRAGTDTACF